MPLVSAVLTLLMSVAPTERPAVVVGAADSPVRLDRAIVLTASQGPPILFYAATNLTENDLEQFTVIAFILDEKGTHGKPCGTPSPRCSSSANSS